MKCEALETEIDGLLENDLAIAQKENNERVVGHVLLSHGSVGSARYLQRRSELMRTPFRAKLWFKFPIVHYRYIEQLVIFPGESGPELEGLIDSI